DRHQRRRAGAYGLVPVHRLEPVVLRRPAPAGRRGRPLLHAAEDHPDALVRIAAGVGARPGVEALLNLFTFRAGSPRRRLAPPPGVLPPTTPAPGRCPPGR